MAYRFPYVQAIAVLAVLAVVAVGSWGLVVGISSISPAKTEAKTVSMKSDWSKGWQIPFRDLIRDNLESTLDARVVEDETVEAAIKEMLGRLTEGETYPFDVEVVVVDRGEVNALTFPGGLIVVFRGLIEKSDNAEQVALVLAHELGHVKHDDAGQALARNLAIEAVLASTTGDPNLFREVGKTLTKNAFSKQVEARADDYALALAAKKKIAPKHLAEFFKKLDRPSTQFVEKNLPYLTDHPTTLKRIEKAEAAQSAFSETEVPFEADWDAVQDALR